MRYFSGPGIGFLQFDYIWLLFLIPVFIGIYLLGNYIQRRKLGRLSDKNLIPSIMKNVNIFNRHLLFVLFLAAYTLLVFALMQPQWGTEEYSNDYEKIEVVIAVDLSKSMLAMDIEETEGTRISREKATTLSIEILLDQLVGNRVSLIGFADSSVVFCPMTRDLEIIKSNFLMNASAGAFPFRGSLLSVAVEESVSCFTDYPVKKVVIIYSDGESHSDISHEDNLDEAPSIIAAKNLFEEDDITIYTVGVGTDTGERIPLVPYSQENSPDETTYMVDAETGETIWSKLEEDILRKIADTTGGKYFNINDSNLEEELAASINRFTNGPESDDNLNTNSDDKYIVKTRPKDRYQVFLFPVIAFIFLIALIPERKKRK